MSRFKTPAAKPKAVHGADQERQLVQPTPSPEKIITIWDENVYHHPIALPDNWKRLELEISGDIKTETNTTYPRIGFEGANIPANIKDARITGNGWGYAHSSYQYCEQNWHKNNMFSGQYFRVGMPIGGGYYYGDNTYYRWKVVATVLPGNRVMVHSDVTGNRREEYQLHWIIQGAFNLWPQHVEALDFGFQGQEISMSGTAKILAYDAP